jgi:hypothetical protein
MDPLTDAPVANILILAGVVFVAVGIFGRMGGFSGSIFGNIEAGRNSRALAGVLGLLLIGGGAWLHERGDKPGTSNTAATGTTAPANGANSASAVPAAGAPALTPSAPRHTADVPATGRRTVQDAKPPTRQAALKERLPAVCPDSSPSLPHTAVGTATAGGAPGSSCRAGNRLRAFDRILDQLGPPSDRQY